MHQWLPNELTPCPTCGYCPACKRVAPVYDRYWWEPRPWWDISTAGDEKGRFQWTTGTSATVTDEG